MKIEIIRTVTTKQNSKIVSIPKEVQECFHKMKYIKYIIDTDGKVTIEGL
jgi:hypothetical protein